MASNLLYLCNSFLNIFQNVFSKSIVDPLVFGTCTKTFCSSEHVTISNTLFMVFIEVEVVKKLTEERSLITLEVPT
jgi:hypothetical protein